MSQTLIANVPSPRNVLARVEAFADLNAAAFESLVSVATMHTSRRGHVVAAADAAWPFIGIPFEGTFAVTNDAATARYRIFYKVTRYELFGEASLFDGGLTPGRIVVLSKTARYVRVPHEAVLRVADGDPRFVRRLGASVTQRLREMMQTLANQGTTPVIVRIANVLLAYAVPETGLAPALAPLPNLTQAQIAAAAGTVKEVAARAIAELEAQGCLQRERGHIRFLNRQKLLDLSQVTA